MIKRSNALQCVGSKQLREFYEKEAKRISHQQLMYVRGGKYGLWWHRKRLEYIMSFLKEAFKNCHTTTFADIGCAEGFYLRYITSAWDNVFCVGVDIARNYIKKAKSKVEKPKSDFVVCALENLPFREDCFEVVLCSEVLEHVPNYRKALSELHKVARKGLVISFPGHSYFYEIIRKVGVLRKLIDKITPHVGHVSEVTVSYVESFARARKMSTRVRIAGVLPLELYKFFWSIKLVDMTDNLLCRILEWLHNVNYATIHIMKIEKESN
jgi:ubiquinone/menaquinone biosynthesis C-methylase UbiE